MPSRRAASRPSSWSSRTEPRAAFPRRPPSPGFHSSEVDACLPALRAAASQIEHKPPQDGLVVVSNLTGKPLESVPNAEYWVSHARGAVLFASGVQSAVRDLSCNVLVEVGPQPHLSVQLDAIAAESGWKRPVAVVPTLRNGPELGAAAR